MGFFEFLFFRSDEVIVRIVRTVYDIDIADICGKATLFRFPYDSKLYCKERVGIWLDNIVTS